MIIEMKQLPNNKTTRVQGGQKGQILRDIEDAVSRGITQFELVDDCYNYKYLSQYVREVLDRYYIINYIRPAWKKYDLELRSKYKDTRGGSNFNMYAENSFACKFYKVTTMKDEELGRTRVFVTLMFSEELLETELKRVQLSAEKQHLDFLKKYYPEELKKIK